MKNKSLVAVLAGYLIFFILLLFSTDIVLAVPMKDMYHLKKINPSQYADLLSKFDGLYISFSEKQDVFFTVEFSGYAFIKTGQESSNKSIKLIFKSENDSYEVDAEVLDRFIFRDLFQEKGIIGINHGFITKFSPIKMKNGVYKLYLYCYENENTVGVIDTNLIFEKTYRSFAKTQ